MGYIRHNAIIATAWQAQAVAGLVEYARNIGAEALVGGEVTNGYATVCITPDGSKEGWQTSAEGDERRINIKLWMREHQDFYYEWCEVAYGSDDGKAEVTDSGWVTANDADIALIEAAPDLLDALKDALCALEVCGKDYGYAMGKARAAIAKATGRTG